ncbi:STAS domain-containing protein [Nonomuraea sp. NPDC051191]|uniref:STAS domain-containing protein n=1 Tax=Nonomuraea sp. NPDC051191 TaxID=3364372 RepID=UPI0037944818
MTEDHGFPESFAVSIAVHQDYIVARVAGELDYQFAGLLHHQVKDPWQAALSSALVVDLSGVTFCDSTGVGVLVLLLQQSRQQQAGLVLAQVPARLERILSITGLRAAFQVASSVEQAIQSVTATRAVTPPLGSSPKPPEAG